MGLFRETLQSLEQPQQEEADVPVIDVDSCTRFQKGKCGVCEYRQICGGSRARAYVMTGDYLEEDDIVRFDDVYGR